MKYQRSFLALLAALSLLALLAPIQRKASATALPPGMAATIPKDWGTLRAAGQQSTMYFEAIDGTIRVVQIDNVGNIKVLATFARSK